MCSGGMMCACHEVGRQLRCSTRRLGDAEHVVGHVPALAPHHAREQLAHVLTDPGRGREACAYGEAERVGGHKRLPTRADTPSHREAERVGRNTR